MAGRAEPKRGDLRERLRGQNLRVTWEPVARDCVAEPALIPPLLNLCVDPELEVQKNAGAVVGKIIDLDRGILVPHLPRLLDNLKTNPHDAVKRGTLRVLERIEIPEAVEGEVFDIAMRYVSDYKEPIAIRANAMTTAHRLCQRYPSLRSELQPIVEDLLQQKSSAGITARARRELKLLEALDGLEEPT